MSNPDRRARGTMRRVVLALSLVAVSGWRADAQRGVLPRAVVAPPPAPVGVTIRPVGRAALISWSPVATPAKYRVLRSTDPAKPGTDLTGAITGTSFTDATLAMGTTYYYQVAAVYPNGRQGVSAPAQFSLALLRGTEATPLQLVRPAPPPPPPAKPSRALAMATVWPNPLPGGVTTLVVTGTGFDRLTDVRVGGVHQSWKKESCGTPGTAGAYDGGDSSIVITLASLAGGPTTVDLVGSAGTVSSPLTVDRASIGADFGVNPASAKPGAWVTISGSHLAENLTFTRIGQCMSLASNTTHPSTVTFGGYAATNTTTDGNVIQAQVPTHATGNVTVSTAWHGSATWAKPFVETPVITSVQLGGVQPGGSWWVAGTAMDAIDSAYMGNVKMPIAGKTYDRLILSVPNIPMQVTADFSVSLYARIPGTFVLLGEQPPKVTVVPIASIQSVSPDSGSPGDLITITGNGLADAPAGATNWTPTVWFNGVVSPMSMVNTIRMVSAYIPRAATTGPVKVGNLTGPVVRVIRTPKLSNYYPYNAKVGSTIQVTITSGSDPTAISFGGTAITSGWTVAPGPGFADRVISVPLPPGAKTGPIIVTTPDGSTTWPFPAMFTVLP